MDITRQELRELQAAAQQDGGCQCATCQRVRAMPAERPMTLAEKAYAELRDRVKPNTDHELVVTRMTRILPGDRVTLE